MKKVTCYCMTYGRGGAHIELLEEAVQSFLVQDYPNKELIVLNDCPGQKLVFDHPQVKIVNEAFRYPTLGEKCNAAIRYGDGDLICSWDDDDISLPRRLSLSVERIGDFGYWNPGNYFYFDGQKFHADQPMGYAHNCSTFTRRAFEQCGGYPSTSKAQDALMNSKFLDPSYGVKSLMERIPREQWFFIYRWGLHGLHLSGLSDCNAYYTEIGTRKMAEGEFVLNPRWLLDYPAEVAKV